VTDISPPPQAAAGSALRLKTDQAFLRTTGAPLIAGNSLRILKDAKENYPAWLEAIGNAREKIFFENYIIGNDDVGHQVIAALTGAARRGVRVFLIYDWLGTHIPSAIWEPLVQAGGQIRCFNPFELSSPLGWLSRDHRKSVCVDGKIAFVTGLCASERWMGNPARGVEPWRDTGVEVRGPAVSEVEHAFAQVWETTGGDALPDDVFTAPETIAPEGDIALAVVATAPAVASLYRLDQLIATAAKRTLFLTDAYFVGVAPYVQALRAAAMDGVDVRLLIPGSSDIPWLVPITRAGYRPLLEAGVRIFEWNGSMVHAKTSVADSRWSRVGSSNLNIASWMGNYELDVAVDDPKFGKAMHEMYLQDLENATEIVLSPRNRVRASEKVRHRMRWMPSRTGGSASRAAASALRIGNSVSAALTDRRVLGPAEAGVMAKVGAVLVALAVAGLVWPVILAVPFGIIAGWIGIALLVRAFRLRNKHRSEDGERESPEPIDEAALEARRSVDDS
jgi:cardiolipin synthase A/B